MNPGFLVNMIFRACLGRNYSRYIYLSWGCVGVPPAKLWKSYKIAGRNGEPRRDIAWKINAIQKAMGIEKSEFPELEEMETSDGEMNDEEIQLRREDAGDWGFEKPQVSYTDE